jgi:hypothetical protein
MRGFWLGFPEVAMLGRWSLRSFLSLLSLGPWLSLAGCTEDHPAEPCAQLGQELCEQACTCGQANPDQACEVLVGTAAGGSLQREVNPDGCRLAFERDVCGDTTKTAALFEACFASLGQAACSQVGNPAEWALVLGAACTGVYDCNSGPCQQ